MTMSLVESVQGWELVFRRNGVRTPICSYKTGVHVPTRVISRGMVLGRCAFPRFCA